MITKKQTNDSIIDRSKIKKEEKEEEEKEDDSEEANKRFDTDRSEEKERNERFDNDRSEEKENKQRQTNVSTTFIRRNNNGCLGDVHSE